MAKAKSYPRRGLTLEHLSHPLSAQLFFSDYFEQDFLHSCDRPSGWFDKILSLDDVDRLITNCFLQSSQVRLVNNGQTIPEDEYTNPDQRVDSLKMMHAFANGSTIILNDAGGPCKSLGLFCRKLEAELGVRIQANLYMTPPNSTGFKTHYDTHDVYIVQIAGRKKWELFNSEISLPLEEQKKHDDDTLSKMSVSHTLELKVGDSLYIPRGLPHRATSPEDDYSLHITIGFHPVLTVDLLLDAVYVAATRNVELRRSLPIDGEGDYVLTFDEYQHATKILGILSQHVSLNEIALRAKKSYSASRITFLPGHVHDFMKLGALSIDSKLYWRNHVSIDVLEEQGHVIIMSNGNEVAFPSSFGDIFAELLKASHFFVRDMPSALSSKSKLIVARRLVREGVLSFLNADDGGSSGQL
jgi:mannose-6-phosphate isomerase-like protein (cupin superfamily)